MASIFRGLVQTVAHRRRKNRLADHAAHASGRRLRRSPAGGEPFPSPGAHAALPGDVDQAGDGIVRHGIMPAHAYAFLARETRGAEQPEQVVCPRQSPLRTE